MQHHTIDQTVLDHNRYTTRRKLDSQLYEISDPLSRENQGLYSIVENAFTAYALLRGAISVWDSGNKEAERFSSIYSSYIAAEYALDSLEARKAEKPSEKPQAEDNYFAAERESFKDDAVDIERHLLSVLSGSLKRPGGRSKQQLMVEYFSWLSDEAQRASADQALSSLLRIVYNSSVVVMGRTFNGFDFQRDERPQQEQPKLTWHGIGGYGAVKEQFRKYCFFLKRAKSITEQYGPLSTFIPKGILLEGPPGTGKTLFAKTLCHESGVDFYSFDQADVGSKYKDEAAIKLRKLIDRASGPVAKGYKDSVIIFIDELDSLAGTREGSQVREDNKVVTALGTHMCGEKAVGGVIFIGATNRRDLIDPSLLRPGKFEEHIEIGYPDDEALAQIYRVHMDSLNQQTASGRAFDASIDTAVLAAQSSNGPLSSAGNHGDHLRADASNRGFTGALIEKLMRNLYSAKVYESARHENQYKPITQEEILEWIARARQRILQ